MKKLVFLLPLLATFCVETSNYVVASGYPVHANLEKTTYHLLGNGGFGTGSQVITPSGKKVIVTNWHVCQINDSTSLRVVSEYFGSETVHRVIKTDPIHDLCVLEGMQDRPALTVGKEIKLLHNVYSAGYPSSSLYHIRFVKGYRSADVSIDLDYPSKTACLPGFKAVGSNRKCRLNIHLVDTTLLAEPGNSGSPVVNSRGELIGVINSTNNTHGAMLPLDDVKNFLSDL